MLGIDRGTKKKAWGVTTCGASGLGFGLVGGQPLKFQHLGRGQGLWVHSFRCVGCREKLASQLSVTCTLSSTCFLVVGVV